MNAGVGPLWLDIASTEPTAEEKERLRHPSVGGVVLFARNHESPERTRRLCDELRALKEPPLLLTVDQEGGRVQRFVQGLTRLPAAASLGALYDKNREEALSLATDLGWLLAAELAALGVDVTLAPVVDLAASDGNGVIASRSPHTDPDAATALARATLDGLGSAGVSGVAKHFPGHGGVTGDTHTGLCVDQRPFSRLWDHDMKPYRVLAASGLPAVMTAHVIYPCMDSRPASYSEVWLRRVLRREMAFPGLVVSDDLNMRAAAGVGDGGDRALACLSAGCDMAILCNDPVAAGQALDRLGERWLLPVSKVEPLRRRGPAPTLDEVRSDARWRRTRGRARGELALDAL